MFSDFSLRGSFRSHHLPTSSSAKQLGANGGFFLFAFFCVSGRVYTAVVWFRCEYTSLLAFAAVGTSMVRTSEASTISIMSMNPDFNQLSSCNFRSCHTVLIMRTSVQVVPDAQVSVLRPCPLKLKTLNAQPCHLNRAAGPKP